ncbi:hypothetical protein RhiirB3_485451 [Rhizophagus irregularis]|nr:hypothetical protein RhiirB3_485451 [Rhizophagus irregularis]
MISYIKHIVWRYAKNDPENFKLLDVRHNVMKNLILGDCDHLIKFILFGDEEENTENKNVYKEIEVKEKREKVKRQEFEIRHIPRDNLWPEESFLKDDDLDFYERKDNRLEDNEKIKPRNNMELAIYHCKGRELKDTIIVAYFLEYYSRNATDCAGWMSSVSKALPLLFKYNYDDYARKLFFKECFADQDHFSAHDPDDIIPIECRERRNHDIKFRAFKPLVRLESNKYKWFVLLRNPDSIKIKESTYSGIATNDLKNETLDIKLKSDFDPKSSDNPYSLFSDAIIATYFWIGGNWAQRDEFDFWAIDVFSLIASIFLVIVLQNMLIAFMNGIYTTAETKGRQALLRQRANHIADYEALYHIHLWNIEPEPKHIYYFGQSKTLEEWYATRKDEQERDYDKYSILVYEEDIKVEIEKIKNMKNDVNVTIEYLIKKLYDIKSKVDDNKTDDDDDDDDGNIEIMEDIEKNINDVVERLLKKLDKSN